MHYEITSHSAHLGDGTFLKILCLREIVSGLPDLLYQ